MNEGFLFLSPGLGFLAVMYVMYRIDAKKEKNN